MKKFVILGLVLCTVTMGFTTYYSGKNVLDLKVVRLVKTANTVSIVLKLATFLLCLVSIVDAII